MVDNTSTTQEKASYNGLKQQTGNIQEQVKSNSFEQMYIDFENNRKYDAMAEDTCLMLMVCLEIRKLNWTVQHIADCMEDTKRYSS